MRTRRTRNGQSLAEILIAVAIGVLAILGAVLLISPALQGGGKAARIQGGTAVGKELLDTIRVFAESNWQNVAALSTSTASKYYLIASSSPFTATSGIESVVLVTSTYNRYFTVSDVYRDANGLWVAQGTGGRLDPSSKLATVFYSTNPGSTSSLAMILTRGTNNVLDQNDWAGGPGQNGPVTVIGNQFATSTNIDWSNTKGNASGSVIISLP